MKLMVIKFSEAACFALPATCYFTDGFLRTTAYNVSADTTGQSRIITNGHATLNGKSCYEPTTVSPRSNERTMGICNSGMVNNV